MKKIIISLILGVAVLGGVSTIGVVYSQNKKAEVLTESNGTSTKNENILDETKTTIENTNSNNEKLAKNDGQAIQSQDTEKVDIENISVDFNIVNENTSTSSGNDERNSEVKDGIILPEVNNQVNQPEIEVPEVGQSVQIPTDSSSFMAQVESLIFTKVNEERAKAGVTPLSYNNTMEYYARLKSQDMGDREYFDHTNPEGELITAQMQRDGVGYSAWGENIAYIGGNTDANDLANQFMINWMNSSGHRANILSTNFSSIGVGVYKVGNKVYATQEFYR